MVYTTFVTFLFHLNTFVRSFVPIWVRVCAVDEIPMGEETMVIRSVEAEIELARDG
jgi:hypothetical protein